MASRKKYQASGGDAKSLPVNFSAKKPADASAPRIGGSSFGPSPNSHKRGKDGTRG